MRTPDEISEIIDGVLQHGIIPYDPAKAHEYYLRTRKLKGRQPGFGSTVAPMFKSGLKTAPTKGHHKTAAGKQKHQTSLQHKAAAKAKIARLTLKLHSLHQALGEAEKALRTLRAAAKKNSDGKTTQKEKIAAKQYRDTHQSQIKSAEKKATAAASKAAPKATAVKSTTDVSKMNEKQLTDRISKIKGLITNANTQIKAAHDSLK